MGLTFKTDNRLKKLKGKAEKATDKALKELGDIGLELARAEVPVDTGDLRDSIVVELEDNEMRLTIRQGDTRDYAQAVEERSPYIEPAMELIRREAPKEIAKAMKRVTR